LFLINLSGEKEIREGKENKPAKEEDTKKRRSRYTVV
jgi:hypothetical protein